VKAVIADNPTARTTMPASDDAPKRRSGPVKCAINPIASLNITPTPKYPIVTKPVAKLRPRSRMGQPKLHPESGCGAENILMEKVNSLFAASWASLN
jgi:hypothetical protein